MTIIDAMTCICGGNLITTMNDELVCEICGLVASDGAIMTSFWVRREDPDMHVNQFVSRVSPHVLYPLGSDRVNLPRLRRNRYLRPPPADERLQRAILFLWDLTKLIPIPHQTHIRAATLLRKHLSASWATNAKVLTTACFLCAAREHGLPIRRQAVVKTASMLTRIPNHLLNQMLLHLGISRHMLRPKDFVSQLISALQADERLQEKLSKAGLQSEVFMQQVLNNAVRLLKMGVDHGGRQPSALAAAYCYLAGQPYITQKMVAVYSCEYTVRDGVRFLRQSLNLPIQFKGRR